MNLQQIELRTDRLLLRELQASDWEAVQAYASDPEVVQYMVWGPNTPEETREWLELRDRDREPDPRNDFELAICLREGGQLIGACGLTVAGADRQLGILGYCMHRDYWGKGYMTEAAGALIRLGFETLDMHRIIATCDTRNIGSARVMEKNGMRREAHYREDVWLRGEWRDSYLYAILQEEWREEGNL